jgi:hypothetical protein
MKIGIIGEVHSEVKEYRRRPGMEISAFPSIPKCAK